MIKKKTDHQKKSMTVQFLTGTMVACPRQLLGRSHLPYTLVTGDLNLVPKNWSKSEVHSPDLYEDVCKIKRPIPPSHPPSQTHIMSRLALPIILHPHWQNPPLPSEYNQCSRQNLREKHRFHNGGWTKWEAVQLMDKLEAKWEIKKAKWSFCKEADKGLEVLDLWINEQLLLERDDLFEEAISFWEKLGP